MKLEQQVTSLELSKKLKELGFKQESLFYWHHHLGMSIDENCNPKEPEDYGIKLFYDENRNRVINNDENWSAYTVAELGELMMRGLKERDEDNNLLSIRYSNSTCNDALCYCDKNANYTVVLEKNGESDHVIIDFEGDHSEANARAKMLIYLKENNLI